ncbi:MAG: hypothetical protein COA58_01145 [Bacteroidetes bacterium]|nr:MAG: hypothetical protein COA58_01145 [Bacteroidota bacterium]
MNYTTKSTLLIILTLTIASLFSSCDDQVTDPPNPNEEELITSVELTFTDTSSKEQFIFKFADTDGDGGNAPIQTDTIHLTANTFYTLNIRFLDESSTTTEDITEEVKEEANEHLICYTLSGSSQFEITDKDDNGLNLGLAATVQTKDIETSTFTISLKHQPEIKDGSCDKGETDVEVSFQMEVK